MKKFYQQSTIPNIVGEELPKQNIPKKIGPYKIEALLNKGGMSFLYLGMDPKKNLPVVIKVLSPGYMNHPEMVSQFLKESSIIAMTDHPNIVKLYERGEWEQGLYISMEFIQGISLKQFVVQQNLSIRSSLETILQVAYALLHLHTHGVIHRDLKPENILITEDGGIKVIDFGIAQLHGIEDNASFTKRFSGTPDYMSPEQKKDPTSVTYATDIYSLGVVAFELIVGRLSYPSTQLSLLPTSIKKIVEKALNPLVKERYQDIVDLIIDITQLLKENKRKKEGVWKGELKEIWQALEEGYATLLPEKIPKWKFVEMHFATSPQDSLLGSLYDFIPLPDQSHLILFSKCWDNPIHTLAYIGRLKGMVQSLIHTHLATTSQPLTLIPFITHLNTMLGELLSTPKFALELLHLLPLENRFSFISCGYPPLIHFTAEKREPRFLTHTNPLLGSDPQNAFYETRENWYEGDTLIIHSVKAQPEKLEFTIKKFFRAHPPPFTQKHIEQFLYDLDQSFSTKDPHQHILSIQRIA